MEESHFSMLDSTADSQNMCMRNSKPVQIWSDLPPLWAAHAVRSIAHVIKREFHII
jgi:hypothetical protein